MSKSTYNTSYAPNLSNTILQNDAINKETLQHENDCRSPLQKNDNDLFQREKDYLIARNIAVLLRQKSLLTDDEFEQIDALLRQRFSPIFSALIADNPCYV